MTKEYINHHFKDHKAEVLMDNDQMFMMDWKAPESSIYAVRYILDKEKGDLFVSGDLGSGVVSWYNETDPEKLTSLVRDVPYFASKVRSFSDEMFTYRFDDVRDDINRLFDEKKESGDFDAYELEKDRERLTGDYSICEPGEIPKSAESILYDYEEDPKEYAFGKRINPRIGLWSAGYIMAIDDCKSRGLLEKEKRETYYIIPKTDLAIEITSASKEDALIDFAEQMDTDMNQYFMAVTEDELNMIHVASTLDARAKFVTDFMKDELMGQFDLTEQEADKVAKAAYEIYCEGNGQTEYECIKEAYEAYEKSAGIDAVTNEEPIPKEEMPGFDVQKLPTPSRSM